jgi:rod shape determining protein RodA
MSYLNEDNYIINIRNIIKVDFLLLSLLLILSIIGFAMLYSAGSGSLSPWATSQIKRFILFIPIFLFIISVNIKIIYQLSYYIYFFALSLLLYAEFNGYTAMGAKRWIDLGFFNLQPSEFLKLALIIALARYFNNVHIYKIRTLYFLFFPIVITIIPVYLILRQPDLGTALILLITAIMVVFIIGTNISRFIIAALISMVSVPFLWGLLKTYQKQRILTFLNPENDPLGSGYNIIQSKIAIGSGGAYGKGFLSGSQGQLDFLPERETDFIFTMIAEEFGFMGSFLIISIFTMIFLRVGFISLNAQSYFGKVLAAGLGFFLFIHFFINIAMVMGLIPVVGAPLPLISYGGTMLITTLTSFALILNVAINKEINISHSKKKFKY